MKPIALVVDRVARALTGVLIVLAWTASSAPPANAALISSATATRTTFRDCRVVDALSAAGFVGNPIERPLDCGSGQAFLLDESGRRDPSTTINLIVDQEADFTVDGPSGSEDYYVNEELGRGRGTAEFGSLIGAPVLKAEAISTINGRVGASVDAIQRFDNTGSDPLSVVFGGEFDSVLSNINADAVEYTGAIVGFEGYITGDTVFNVEEPFGLPGALAIGGALRNTLGIENRVLNEFFDTGDPMEGLFESTFLTSSFEIPAGESLFINVSLLTIGARGSSTNAFSTLTTGFYADSGNGLTRIVDPDNPLFQSLRAATVGVPAPSPAFLLLAGLSLLATRRKLYPPAPPA